MMNANTSVASSDTGARIKRGIIKTLEYLALILGSFVALLPIVSSFMTSFKSAEEYAATNAMTPPRNWLNFANYRQVWVEGDMLRAFLTSFGVVIVVVLVSVMMGSMLAYVLNRFAFPGNNLIRNLFMIATLIPGIAMQVTTYQIMRQLGLLNSILGYMILMSGTDVISIYIFLQFFENLNVALDESAVLEGYTGLYTAWPDAEVRRCLYNIFDILQKHIWNPEKRRQEVFFDMVYHSLIDLYSFGHDIETSWLADRTLDLLDDPALTARIRPMLLAMADQTSRQELTDHGFANECERGTVDTKRVWWIQAEALVGCLNAWERTGEARYRDAVLSQWRFIRNAMIDRRPGSEWFGYLREDGTPIGLPIVEPWKCPYHNGRMALEVMRRNPGI